jgi:thioredoxin 1
MIKILDLYADWCRPCKILSPILDELEKELEIEVDKINVEDNDEIAEFYNVRNIPTLIFFKDNEKVHQIVGERTKQQLIDIIKSLE